MAFFWTVFSADQRSAGEEDFSARSLSFREQSLP
jgi:hypothetical protein